MGGHKLLIFVHTALLTYGILLCICSFADATITDFLCRSTQSEPLINPKREILHNHYHDLLLSRLRRWIQPQRSLTKSSASNISRIWLAILGGDCIGTLLSNDLIITTAKCATKYADQHQHQHLPLSQAIIPKILVLHGSQMSLNEQSTNRIVDSIYVHPRGIDIAYIRLKKQHLEQKETGNAIYRTQSDSKLSILSPMRLTVNSNTMLPRPDGMARAVVIDDTHTDALLTNSNTEQTVTTTLRTSDFPVVPTSKCHTNESDLESSPVTDESYLCLLNNDAHSYCKVQLRLEKSHSGAPLVQYSESGKPVLLGVFTGSFSSLSGEHSLFVRTSSVISHGFLPIDELDLFFNDINIDNNNNREGEANRAEMQMEKETLVNREQARSNESLIEEAMPTTEADSDEGGSGGNKKKKKEEGGPTAMAIVSYMGLGFIALVMTAACIIVNIFDRRT